MTQVTPVPQRPKQAYRLTYRTPANRRAGVPFDTELGHFYERDAAIRRAEQHALEFTGTPHTFDFPINQPGDNGNVYGQAVTRRDDQETLDLFNLRLDDTIIVYAICEITLE